MYIYEHCTLTSSYVCKKLLLTRPQGDLVTGGGEIGKGRNIGQYECLLKIILKQTDQIFFIPIWLFFNPSRVSFKPTGKTS